MYLNKINTVIRLSAALMIVSGLASCGGKDEKKVENQGVEISDTLLRTMTTATAKITQVHNEIKLTGKVVTDQSKQLEVFPLVGGIIKSVNVEIGDYVEKDQVLAVIKSGEVADYEKQMIDARSNFELAKKNMQVAEDMYAAKLMSERDYISAKQDLNKAQADLNKANELQKIYTVNQVGDYLVKAPISGFIIDKKVNKDMQIRPDNSESIFSISQLNNVWVLANVYESDINKVREKDTVFVNTIAYAEKTYTATIDKLYNVLDPETRVMKVRIKLENPDYLLKPEMYASVVVNYEEPKQMLTIPSNALVFDNSNNYVIIYGGDKTFVVEKVDLYKSIGDRAYLNSGVKVGDKVVTRNQLLIYNALTNN